MPKRVAFLSSQFAEVKSGPGRFAQYLQEIHVPGVEFYFFSEQIAETKGNEIRVEIPFWVKKLPLSWIFKAWFYSKKLKEFDIKFGFHSILSSDYSLAINVRNSFGSRLITMVNDDNYLLIFEKGDHQSGMSLGRRWARRLGYFFEKSVVKKSSIVVSNSLYTKGLVEKIYQIPANQSILLYKAVDLTLFQFQKKDFRNPRKFLFVKNDWRRGGLDLIFQSFAQLPFQEEMEFTVAGISESQLEQVKQVAASSGFKGKYQILGLLNRAELKNAFQSAQVFITMSRQEALGVSCLEAQASGVAVVASEAGGLPEVLNFGEAGFLVRKNDRNRLVETIMEMNSNPEMTELKVQNSLHHVEKFSIDQLKMNLAKLFQQPSGD